MRVIAIHSSTLAALSAIDAARVQSMLGGTFTVYEVDRWGRAWVEKWWRENDGHSTSHSLALEPLEMEVASRGRASD